MDDGLNDWIKDNIPFLNDTDLMEDYPLEIIKDAYRAGVRWGEMQNKYNKSISHIYFEQGRQSIQGKYSLFIDELKAIINKYEDEN